MLRRLPLILLPTLLALGVTAWVVWPRQRTFQSVEECRAWVVECGFRVHPGPSPVGFWIVDDDCIDPDSVGAPVIPKGVAQVICARGITALPPAEWRCWGAVLVRGDPALLDKLEALR